jgi:hypothetical protein
MLWYIAVCILEHDIDDISVRESWVVLGLSAFAIGSRQSGSECSVVTFQHERTGRYDILNLAMI